MARLVLASFASLALASQDADFKLTDQMIKAMPNMQAMIDLADTTPETLLTHINESPAVVKVRMVDMPEASPFGNSSLPIVTGHGMGDSCFEPGFKSITKAIGKRTGTYAVCIPTGDGILRDTIDGFLMSMDKSVDVFAKKIKADPKLAGGFNAIGFSQGNSLIRGYIHKYNDPPVVNFISAHGTVMGVAAFPQCFRQGKPLGLICKAFAEVLGDLAYNGLAQNILFQAGYYRDPKWTNSKAYKKHSQIAQWNNEGETHRELQDQLQHGQEVCNGEGFEGFHGLPQRRRALGLRTRWQLWHCFDHEGDQVLPQQHLWLEGC